MKKLVVIIAALLVASSAHAQIGVTAGLTSSSTSLSGAYGDLVSMKNLNQFHVGVTYNLGLGNLIALQPALIYNVKGTKLDVVGYDAGSFKTGFLEIPVQVQVGFGIGSLARVYGFAEPFIGYAVYNNVKGLDGAIELENKWDVVDDRFEYGIGFGAGVELLSRLQVSIKYFWNLSDLYEDINLGSIAREVTSSKCSGIAVSAVVFF